MDKISFLLLKTLLRSTSRLNKIKYSTDKKVKNKAIGGFVGVVVLFALIMFYSIMMCVGYGQMGLASGIPVICSAMISLLAFVFTIFKTNGYLFAFKEYDMLMSLPFSPKSIAADKFLYMYIASLPWFLSLSIAMMVGYGIYARPNVFVYVVWLVLTFFLPIIPMLAAAFLGFLIAKVSAGFRKKNIVQTILTFVFVIFCFSLQYIIEAVVKSEDTKLILENISGSIEGIGKGYWPIAWFSNAVRELVVSDFLLLVGSSLVLFEIVFLIVGHYYRQINSALKSHGSSKEYKMTAQKKHSVLNAVAYKEFKRMTGSSVYLVNGAMGEVLTFLFAIVCLFLDFDKIVSIVTKGAPISATVLFPAIPLIVYFFTGMVATTACSPSLEGKNYWIMQSLPIEKKVIFQGKMLFNLYLTVPFAVFAVICLSFSAKVPLVNCIIYVLEILALCCFSTTWGCVCGIKHMRLDWENEIEVVKQGAAVTIYLLPNMFVTMGLLVLVVFLGFHMDANVVSLILTAVALGLAALCYCRVLRLAEKK